jgi:hypothetical protein
LEKTENRAISCQNVTNVSFAAENRRPPNADLSYIWPKPEQIPRKTARKQPKGEKPRMTRLTPHACAPAVADGSGFNARAAPAVADDAGANAAENDRSVPTLPKLTGTNAADRRAQVDGCQQLPATGAICTSGAETARRCISRRLRSAGGRPCKSRTDG